MHDIARLGLVAGVLQCLAGCALDGRDPGALQSAGDAAVIDAAHYPGEPAVSGSGEPLAASMLGASESIGVIGISQVGTLLEAGASEVAFGAVVVGQAVTLDVQLRSKAYSGLVVDLNLSGPDASNFSVLSDCPKEIPPMGACNVSVRFAPALASVHRAELQIHNLTQQVQTAIPITGLGLAAGPLHANVSSFDFGRLEVGGAGEPFRWELTNVGAVNIGPLTLRQSGEGFEGANGCAAGLAPGGSCRVDVAFTPPTGGIHWGNLVLSAADQQIALSVSGRGRFRVTVERRGAGEISSPNGEFECSANVCTGLCDPGAMSLSARTENGQGSFFAQWSPGDCGPSQTCRFELDAPRTFVAEFRETQNNLVFVTSQYYRADLGGLAAYDAECNRAASAAGINDASGNAFIAALSDSTTSLRVRLGAARGWVRLDGRTFADTVDDLFSLRVYYPVDFYENGASFKPELAGDSRGLIWTGTNPDGSSAPTNCNGWTSASAMQQGTAGLASAGTSRWIDNFSTDCAVGFNLACLGITRSNAAPRTPVAGKRLWVSTEYLPGSMTPDQKCDSETPAGVSRGVAFLNYSNRSAGDVLDATANYVRPDGALIGTGAAIANLKVIAGPWVLADETVSATAFFVWTGADQGQPSSRFTCNDWGSGDESVRGGVGDNGRSDLTFFDATHTVTCNTPLPILCVEP